MDYRVLAVLLAGIATVPASDIYLPSLPGMADYFAISAATAKNSIVVYQIGSVIGALILGFLADHWERRPLFIASLGFFVTGTLICASTSHFSLFIFGRLLEGAGAVSIPVVGWAMIHDMYNALQSAKIMSIFGAVFSFVPLVSPSLGGHMDALYGWQSNFLLLGIVSTCILLFFILRFKEPRIHRNRQELSLSAYLIAYKSVLTNKIFSSYVLVFAVLLVGEWFYLTHVSFFLESTVGMHPENIGIYIASVGMAYFLASMLTARLIDRFGLERTIDIGLKTSCFGAILMIATVFAANYAYIVLAAGMSVFFAGLAFAWSPSTTVSLQAVKQRKGLASSARSIIYIATSGLGSFLARFAPENSLVPIILTVCVCSFLALWIYKQISVEAA